MAANNANMNKSRMGVGNNSNVVNNGNKRGGKRLWVFGYGSLCWYTGFPYEQEVVGHIRGFSRRFWQGNVSHRGTPGKPGRVATLVKEPDGVTWGKAYQLTDATAYEYLEQREGALGGYTHALTWFWPATDSANKNSDDNPEKIQVLVYMATPDGPHWLGPVGNPELAAQVARSRGPSGHNAEYVLRLARFMRATFPEERDDDLYELEALVLAELGRLGLGWDEVMHARDRVDPARLLLVDADRETGAAAEAGDYVGCGDQQTMRRAGDGIKEKVGQRNSAPAKLSIQRPAASGATGKRCLKL